MLSHIQLFATPWTVAATLLCPWDSPGKNTGSGLPFPPPGDLPNPGIERESAASPALQVDSLPLNHQGRRRQWHPTPVLLLGKSHGLRSLVGCRPWSLRVRKDWKTSLSCFTFLHWRRKWQPTPVFLPGESQRRGSLVGGRLWGRTESDMTEAT